MIDRFNIYTCCINQQTKQRDIVRSIFMVLWRYMDAIKHMRCKRYGEINRNSIGK